MSSSRLSPLASRLGPDCRVAVIGAGWAGLAAAVYAAIDEGLQAIPMIRRNAAWDDLAANIGGITMGMLIAMAWTVARRPAGREESAS